jgi:hypothetical protein
LSDVDLQPHRTRYWKTPRLDARFKERAEQVLWCYGNATRLAEQGIWVVCVDEIPTFQILERDPIRRAIPGSIEQQEFDYTRHGTVNMLVFLAVHSGLMELVFLAKNDHEHYLPELELFRRQHKELKGVFLIQDGGASHIAAGTRRYFAESQEWWKPRYTPANASWLNQAEILIHNFKPGLSGWKSLCKRELWNQSSPSMGFSSERASFIGVFSKRETLKICKISCNEWSTFSSLRMMATST